MGTKRLDDFIFELWLSTLDGFSFYDKMRNGD